MIIGSIVSFSFVDNKLESKIGGYVFFFILGSVVEENRNIVDMKSFFFKVVLCWKENCFVLVEWEILE